MNDHKQKAVTSANDFIQVMEDQKRYLDMKNQRVQQMVSELQNQKKIPSFPKVFANSKTGNLSDEEKRHKIIIQFSFVVMSCEEQILLLGRDPVRSDIAGSESTKYHNVTGGESILISWSPFGSRYSDGGSYFPMSEKDILDIYHREVMLEARYPIAAVTPLCFVSNVVKDKTYWFYVFLMKYDVTAAKLLGTITFKKDQDKLCAFAAPVDLLPTVEKLAEAATSSEQYGQESPKFVKKNKADLRVLGVLAGLNGVDPELLAGSMVLPIDPCESQKLPDVLYGDDACIYISYPEGGYQYARELAARLVKRGYSVYVPQYEMSSRHDYLWYSRVVLFICISGTSQDKNVEDDSAKVEQICCEPLRMGTYSIMQAVFEHGDVHADVCPELFKNHARNDVFVRNAETKNKECRWNLLLQSIEERIQKDFRDKGRMFGRR